MAIPQDRRLYLPSAIRLRLDGRRSVRIVPAGIPKAGEGGMRMAGPTSATPFFRRVLREPTFHFVLLAAALFAANAALEWWRGNVITVDPVQISVRIAELEAIRGSPLSPEERQLVEDAYIDEQILVGRGPRYGAGKRSPDRRHPRAEDASRPERGRHSTHRRRAEKLDDTAMSATRPSTVSR